MAKYIHSGGKRVQFNGEDIRLDSKNRMYVQFSEDTTIPNVGVISKDKKTLLINVDGNIQIQSKGK